jgi:hypothetical protein
LVSVLIDIADVIRSMILEIKDSTPATRASVTYTTDCRQLPVLSASRAWAMMPLLPRRNEEAAGAISGGSLGGANVTGVEGVA